MRSLPININRVNKKRLFTKSCCLMENFSLYRPLCRIKYHTYINTSVHIFEFYLVLIIYKASPVISWGLWFFDYNSAFSWCVVKSEIWWNSCRSRITSFVLSRTVWKPHKHHVSVITYVYIIAIVGVENTEVKRLPSMVSGVSLGSFSLMTLAASTSGTLVSYVR